MSTLNATNLKNPSSGSNNIVLGTDGTTTIAAPSNIIKSSTVNAGGTNPFNNTLTSVDFTGIPSWVKRVTVMFGGVSTSGTSQFLFQIGAGSIDNASYNSSSFNVISSPSYGSTTSTAGFVIGGTAVDAASVYGGTATLTLLGSNIWTFQGVFGVTGGTQRGSFGGGNKALSATLDRVRITTVNGSDTFDAGSINILYEG